MRASGRRALDRRALDPRSGAALWICTHGDRRQQGVFAASSKAAAEYPLVVPSLPSISARARARLAYVAVFTSVGAQAPYFVLVYQSRGFDLATIGPIVGLGSLAGLVAAPLWGAVSDRVRGAPALLLAPMGVALLGTAGLWVFAGWFLVAISAALVYIGNAGIAPIIEARGLETSGDSRAGYGPLRAFGSLSFIVAVWIIGIAIQGAGANAALAAFALAILATGLIGLTLQPASSRASAGNESRGYAADVHAETESFSPAPAAVVTPGLREFRQLLATPRLGVFLVGAALAWMSVSGVVGYYALRFGELAAPASEIGLAFAVGAAVEIPVMTQFPRLAARVGGERLIIIGGLVLAMRALIAGLTTDPAVLVVAAGIGGIGFALFLVGGVTFVSRLAPPELQATAQGVFQSVTVGVGAIGAGLLATIFARPIGLGGLFVLVAALCLVATSIVVFAVRPSEPVVPAESAPQP
jgi:MFS transporter, PPP family, 3-phenylpropionic acid transporter